MLTVTTATKTRGARKSQSKLTSVCGVSKCFSSAACV